MNIQANPQAETIEQGIPKEKGRPPGRGSIFWDVITDMNNGALLPSIAIMQSATPAVGTAVNTYALYKYDALGRAIRTNWSLMRFLYDGGNIAYEESEALRKLHANIKGTYADGTKYFALNPLSFRIVPDTFLDGIIRIRKDIGQPLSKAEEEQLYEEYVQLCLLFGIPRKYIEPTLEDFYVYYENLMRTGMTFNETVEYLIGDTQNAPPRLPKLLSFLQPRMNKYFHETMKPRNRIAYVGSIHPTYRKAVGIKWDEEDQEKYEKLCAAIAKRSKRIPRFLRTNPTAHLLRLGYRGPGLVTKKHLDEAKIKLDERKAKKAVKAA